MGIFSKDRNTRIRQIAEKKGISYTEARYQVLEAPLRKQIAYFLSDILKELCSRKFAARIVLGLIAMAITSFLYSFAIEKILQ